METEGNIICDTLDINNNIKLNDNSLYKYTAINELPKLNKSQDLYSLKIIKGKEENLNPRQNKFKQNHKYCFSQNLETNGIYDKRNYNLSREFNMYSSLESPKRKMCPIILNSIKVKNNNNKKNKECQEYYLPIMIGKYLKKDLSPLYFMTSPQENKFNNNPKPKVTSLKKIIDNKLLKILEEQKEEQERFIEEDNKIAELLERKKNKIKIKSPYRLGDNNFSNNCFTNNRNLKRRNRSKYNDYIRDQVCQKRKIYKEQMENRFLVQHAGFFGENRPKLRALNQFTGNEEEDDDFENENTSSRKKNVTDATNIILNKLPTAKVTGYEKEFLKQSNKSVEFDINKRKDQLLNVIQVQFES